MGQSTAGSNWTDLGPRAGAGLAMAVVASAAIWLGGMVFVSLISVVIGLCIWELTRLLRRDHAVVPFGLAILSGVAVSLAGYQIESGSGLGIWWLVLLIAPLLGFVLISKDRTLFLAYSALIMLAALGFLHLSHSQLVIWLVLVVITSDVAGYFAGRLLGGPKFWPRVSPKKTWSGTVAGWVGAAFIGFLFASEGSAMFWMLGSVLAAFAGQMGDIIESAIKRYVGIKDSSNLIPGHGGVLDRFDAMIGAAALVYVLSILLALPVFVAG